MTTGKIMNIQKYSIHDGPGIRTTVFFKGCPLRCWWCHNPESLNPNSEIMFFKDKCTACKVCLKRCSGDATYMEEAIPKINPGKCHLCGKCADFCPNNAKELVGRSVSVQDLMKEILKDELFYDESGGGVTFSGGEPLIQIDFLEEMLKATRQRGIHSTVDTSGYTSWDNFKRILDKVDLFLYDIKHMNNEKHMKYIGVSNDRILENLKRLSDNGSNIFIRMPIIAGINDDEANIRQALNYLTGIKVGQVNLLPYHKMGMEKYARLGKQYKLTGKEKPSDETMQTIANKFKQNGFEVKIGG